MGTCKWHFWNDGQPWCHGVLQFWDKARSIVPKVVAFEAWWKRHHRWLHQFGLQICALVAIFTSSVKTWNLLRISCPKSGWLQEARVVGHGVLGTGFWALPCHPFFERILRPGLIDAILAMCRKGQLPWDVLGEPRTEGPETLTGMISSLGFFIRCMKTSIQTQVGDFPDQRPWSWILVWGHFCWLFKHSKLKTLQTHTNPKFQKPNPKP